MAVEFKKVRKPGRKLRKLLKRMGARPTPEQVHDFRTNSRKLEANLEAFGMDGSRLGKRVLKPLSRFRKRAGKIRDMDVLTSYAASIQPQDSEKDCAVQLLEYLGAKRRRHAKKFYGASRQNGPVLIKRLKKLERELAKSEARTENGGRPESMASSMALQLGSRLASGARLNHSNLHPFRLRVKDLRNVLRLADDPDQNLLNALGSVKDVIGEWHDWEELVGIAEKTLDHGTQCKLTQTLKATTQKKFDNALSEAEQLRKRYLGLSDKKRPPRSQSAGPPEPLLRAAMKLAA
jgi:CHAD domain-containing protein